MRTSKSRNKRVAKISCNKVFIYLFIYLFFIILFFVLECYFNVFFGVNIFSPCLMFFFSWGSTCLKFYFEFSYAGFFRGSRRGNWPAVPSKGKMVNLSRAEICVTSNESWTLTSRLVYIYSDQSTTYYDTLKTK